MCCAAEEGATAQSSALRKYLRLAGHVTLCPQLLLLFYSHHHQYSLLVELGKEIARLLNKPYMLVG